MKHHYNLPCNVAQTLNVIGDKWSLLILHGILNGFETYKDIQDNLKGIPTNLLSERLKTLETHELLIRELYQTHPPRYKYKLTEKGLDLKDIIYSIILWGQKYLETCNKSLVHHDCNSNIEHNYYCPVCNKNIDINELKIQDFIE